MKNLKTPAQIALMRKAGHVVWQAHQKALDLIKPGTTTGEIDSVIHDTIRSRGGIPLFLGVPGKVPFPASSCISINDEVVHGIPGDRKLQEGDIVSIDIGVRLNGWCADAAVTHPVGKIRPELQRLLDTTEETLRIAIKLIPKMKRWNEVAKEMEAHVVNNGFCCVEKFVGHHIGRELWEPPQVPNFHTLSMPNFRLRRGTVIAIEPMVNMISKEVREMPDHWTMCTMDGHPSAHFEHTVAITKKGVAVLTAGPDGEGWSL